jgi:hypothetical protein
LLKRKKSKINCRDRFGTTTLTLDRNNTFHYTISHASSVSDENDPPVSTPVFFLVWIQGISITIPTDKIRKVFDYERARLQDHYLSEG